MQKLGVANIIELLQRAADLGLIPSAPACREGAAARGPSAAQLSGEVET
jgi:hypothetical protein